MPDPIFAHPRLAQIYDAFDGRRDDLAAYLAVVDELGARTVLDLGCGTGSLAVLIAGTGRTVVGADPAGRPLQVARGKPGADRVTWVEGDAARIPATPVFDLALMTGNAAQAVLDDGAWDELLGHVTRSLRPGGVFAFETRRLEQEAWREWAAETGPWTVDVPGIGAVEQRREVLEVRLPLVRFRLTYRFLADGAVLSSDSTLRFRTRDEVTASLTTAGFAVDDVREAPDRPGREWVFLARRP